MEEVAAGATADQGFYLGRYATVGSGRGADWYSAGMKTALNGSFRKSGGHRKSSPASTLEANCDCKVMAMERGAHDH